MNENIKLTGAVELILRDSDGNIKQEYKDHNLVVTVGKNYLAAWIAAASQAGEFMDFIALGSGNTAPSASQTALVTELSGGGYGRVAGALSSALNVWTNVATFAPGNGTATIAEVGLFSANSAGTMFARALVGPVTKAAGDTLTVTWNVTFS